MRLEPFCRISMRYGASSWHEPYGSSKDSERIGFGHGDGTVSGALEGTVSWANYPRRRQDGVWTPNLRGMIRARDANQLLLAIHGQSVQEQTDSGYRRAILARVELTSEAEAYRWLNTSFLVGEGEIDEDSEEWWLDTFVCVNEVAHGPPALGAEPPERFRQGR
jgi:hypothetical protein